MPTTPLPLVAAPAYLGRHGTPRTAAELRLHDGLTFSEFGSRSRAPVAIRESFVDALIDGLTRHA